MAKPATNELSHIEALELLPWLVNASLDERLSRQVCDHVDGCEICQQEWAILSSTTIAFNTSEPDYKDVDSRFRNLMSRIREEEMQRQHDDEDTALRRVGKRTAEWLCFSGIGRQWAVAFTLGLIVGGGVLMTVSQWSDSRFDGEYTVLAGDESALRLQVLFFEPPDPQALDRLQEEHGDALRWQRISGREYVIVFPEDASVGDVAAIRSELLSGESVQEVSIDLR